MSLEDDLQAQFEKATQDDPEGTLGFAALFSQCVKRPMYYHRDGKPITLDPLLGIAEVVQWATYFENTDRKVRTTITPYRERLSTIFLGIDHSFDPTGPPIIFETMLFPPDPEQVRRRTIFAAADDMFGRKANPEALRERERFEAQIKKNFPHDGLQLRYSTEADAIESHNKLRLQCLIPPRWRRLLCYEIGGDETWS
jgi:hypothetical protein